MPLSLKHVFLLFVVFGPLASCKVKNPCDENQTVKYGLCVPPGGEGGVGGFGGESSSPKDDECPALPPAVGEPNRGAPCTEGGTECKGGTVCGAPLLPQCVAACGKCDAFFNACPAETTCFTRPEGSACF